MLIPDFPHVPPNLDFFFILTFKSYWNIAVTLFGKHLNLITMMFQIRVICTMSDLFALRNSFIFVRGRSRVSPMFIHERVVIDNSQKIQAFCNVTPYRVLNIYRRFEKWSCFRG